MSDKISPKYLMKLVGNVEHALRDIYSDVSIRHYLDKWHEEDYNGNWENFYLLNDNNGKFDLSATLHKMNGEILLQVAIDIGVETPDFIPSVAVFKNDLKANYERAFEFFTKAYKNISDHPDVAVGLANSTLESIIKKILKDERIKITYDGNKTLYDLTSDILKEFKMFPNASIPIEITAIGSSLLSISQNIEKLRSTKTSLHGKTIEDYVLEDPFHAAFVINCVSTVGLFLMSYYKNKFPKDDGGAMVSDDLPF